ncbi:MAG: carboxypeptidase-like regulatory domain-containing protein [Ignavibacteria bacterium]|jgi:hypothetical protein|nr:carboxypeptidase-like regulatory domain-containing protein [Ignavibacteria bacterium]
MKKAFIIFCLLSSCLIAQTDYTLSGRVCDEPSGKPLANVNVYLANSLHGAMSNDSGYYKISGIHEGQYEVVASLIGYNTKSQVMYFDNARQQKKDFKMSPATYVLEGISVTAEDPKEWRNNYNLFRGLFLGKSSFAEECEIENKELIDLKWESFDILKAKAKVPVTIINNALGYRLNCILEDFTWDRANQMVNYIVKPGFSLLEPKSPQDTLKWKQNRMKAYELSTERFLQSLIENDYFEKGYRIYLDQYPKAQNYAGMSSERINADDLIYKSSKSKGDEYTLKFKGFLRIEYNHETTWLRMLYPEITMDSKGNVKELIPFQVFGAWSHTGIANMLPQYFIAE